MNPNQHVCFFLMFAMTLVFSISVILTTPNEVLSPSMEAVNSMELVDVDGHQVLLVTPRLGSTRRHKSSSIKKLSDVTDAQVRWVLQPAPRKLQPLEQQTHHQAAVASTGEKNVIQKTTTSTTTRASSRAPSNLFLCGAMLMSVFFGVKAGKKIIKTNRSTIDVFTDTSLKDELVYDIAFTTTSSEIGYGSFASSWDEMDKFDL